ncbi:hypothetical protein N752_10830 [Desulforamulus aquiferis]|nr:hypothetical protein N752_10830 [Desulforamulus aquiferis]
METEEAASGKIPGAASPISCIGFFLIVVDLGSTLSGSKGVLMEQFYNGLSGVRGCTNSKLIGYIINLDKQNCY